MTFEQIIAALSELAEKAPGLAGASKAEAQAAFRFKQTAKKLLEKAQNERENVAAALEQAANNAGIKFSQMGDKVYAVAVDALDGIEARKAVIAALREYNRAEYLKAWNAKQAAEAAARKERADLIKGELKARGLDLRAFF